MATQKMTDQFVDANKMVSITPPPELVEQWVDHWTKECTPGTLPQYTASKAAHWGADQELKACLQWFSEFYCMETWMQKDLEKFRLARRPKPPSLAEQALDALNKIEDKMLGPTIEEKLIRRALERLQKLENND